MKRKSVYPFTNFDPPGATIHLLRTRQGWTLDELSRRCGLSISAISRIETGYSGWSRHSLERIAAAVGVRLEHLFLPPDLIDWNFADKDLKTEIRKKLSSAREAQISHAAIG